MELLARAATYYRRHGLRSTAERLALQVRRLARGNRQVLFHYDLRVPPPIGPVASPELRVERVDRESQLDSHDFDRIVGFWNPTIARRQIAERFAKGASLWLARAADQLAGYGWTLSGGTIEPYYFPLAAADVHLFDFLVFPEFRGTGVNPRLVLQILEALAHEGRQRALIEVAEWNAAQLRSLSKTPFRRFGSGRKYWLLGKTVLRWTPDRG
jgi:ribosomal protein S18 acetylase RimI-like enzyme